MKNKKKLPIKLTEAERIRAWNLGHAASCAALEANKSNNINDKQVRGESTKTKQQLTDEIAALQEQLDAMPGVGINYKPKYGEDFFYIDSLGIVNSCIWRDGELDNAYYATGNCYPTEVMALQIVHNRKTLVKLREFAFVPDFNNRNQEKHHFDIHKGALSWTNIAVADSESPVYFETDKLRYDAREAVGEAAIVDMLEGGLV